MPKRERDLSDLEAELEELENGSEDYEPKPKRAKRGRKKGSSNRKKRDQGHLEDLPLVKERFGDNTAQELRESECQSTLSIFS